MNSSDLKHQLLNLCIELQNKRIQNFKQAMDEAQEAANSEEKSTAGDKYDTSRAMSQNARDMNAKQLVQALDDLAILQQINPSLTLDRIKLGSVVKTSNGNYFISTSVGQIKTNNEVYFAVSTTAPICQAMIDAKQSESFEFRNTSIKVLEIF